MLGAVTVDLDRLRELAREPERTPMLRTGQFPTMTAEVLRQKQEISALRRGLLDAIAEIEACWQQIKDQHG
jgi:hypothetical protein